MKLALIGKGPGRELAPLIGEGVVTWGVNDVIAQRNVDVCFWMDRHLMKDSQMDFLTTDAVNHNKTPMYSVRKWDDIPTSIEYPKSEVNRVFGIDYFGDSLCYMIPLALMEGYRDLSFYGFTYAYGNKYITEKPAVEAWIGIALGLGSRVSFVGEHCELFKTKDSKNYSYETPQKMPRENIQIPKIKVPKDSVSLTVSDRVELSALSVFFSRGSYETALFSKRLHDQVKFSDSEAKEINLRTLNDKETQYGAVPNIIWSDNKLPNKTITLTNAEKAQIGTWLHYFSKRGDITWRMLSLYDKFVLGLAQTGESPVPPPGGSPPLKEN